MFAILRQTNRQHLLLGNKAEFIATLHINVKEREKLTTVMYHKQ